MPTVAAVAAAAPAGDCWLIVHELHDSSARWLAQALAGVAGPQGPAVRAVPVPALLAWVRWQLQVDSRGSRCTLDAPGLSLWAGPSPPTQPGPPRARLAGVINRSNLVTLPPGAQDADYKSAEWNALLVAWLHGLQAPVINRPRCSNLLSTMASAAIWRQRAAAWGLPIWPVAVAAPKPQAAFGSPGLLVVGDTCLEPVAQSASSPAPCCSASGHRAAARAAAACGCGLLAWTGEHDDQGTWRISGATPWPDLRLFGQPALHALARLMKREAVQSHADQAVPA